MIGSINGNRIMKRFIYIIISLLTVASCVMVETSQSDSAPLVEKSFGATISPETKIVVGDKVEGGYKALWSPDDRIVVLPDSKDASGVIEGSRFHLTIDEPAESAVFTGMIQEADNYYAVYPAYNSTWYPEEKRIRARIINWTWASGYNCGFMVAKDVDGSFSFKHLSGYIKFTVPENVTDLARVEFTSPDVPISARYVDVYPETMTLGEMETPWNFVRLYPDEGKEVIPPGTYCMSALPAVLSSGFTLDFYNTEGLRYRKIGANETEIKRGKILNLGEIEDVVFDLPVSTCEEVASNGEDGQYYRLKGMARRVENTVYGNWYLLDDTGLMYIYGTLDKDGLYNWDELNIAAGDIVTVQGPKYTFNSTAELHDVSVVEVEKSHVRVTSVSGSLGPADREFKVSLSFEGTDFDVEIPSYAESWVTLTDVTVNGSEAEVTFEVSENVGSARSAELIFWVKDDGKDYYAFAYVNQDSSVIMATAEDVHSAADGQVCNLTGYITSVVNETYGNLYIKDATGEVYVYGVLDAEGNSKQWASMGIKAGDIVQVVGTKTTYKGTPQLQNVKVVEHFPVKDVTVEEFIAAEENASVYYRLKGEVRNILLNDDGTQNVYGDFDVIDDTGSVYVYGLLSGWGGKKQQFQSLNISEGARITLVGVRGQYKGEPQVLDAFYVEHENITE